MVLVFDVNETLLDLAALEEPFERLFGERRALTDWFGQLLQSAMVATLTDRYQDFATLAGESLQLLAKRRGVSISAQDARETLAVIRRLEPHADVKPALDMLQRNGFRLVTLTNSPPATLAAQLEHAGLTDFFEKTLSVDAVRKFKPYPAVYRHAAERLDVSPSEMRLIAAHNWDTTGAIRAGCRAAFVARPGRVLGELDEPVDIEGADLIEVARKIVELDRP